jgi:hypothetical protein
MIGIDYWQASSQGWKRVYSNDWASSHPVLLSSL